MTVKADAKIKRAKKARLVSDSMSANVAPGYLDKFHVPAIWQLEA